MACKPHYFFTATAVGYPAMWSRYDHQASRGTENSCVLALTATEHVQTSCAPLILKLKSRHSKHWLEDRNHVQRTKSIPMLEQSTVPTEVTLTGLTGRQTLTQVAHFQKIKPAFHLNSHNT